MADFLWVEQYRPKTIQDCILPEQTKKTFLEFLKKKEIPNMLLSGTAGTGKTTVARALCDELNADYIIINGSDEGRHIDTLRNKIKNFASTVSFNAESKHKVVIIDEADYMNAESVQPALRNFIETFFENCRFIMTCNYPYKFIEPLRSRLTQIDFKIVNGQRLKSAQSLMKRLGMILDENKVPYDKKVLATLIEKHFPDFRKTINELQRYSVNGTIDSGVLNIVSDKNYDELFSYLKNKDFKKMRSWVVSNIDTDATAIFRAIYDRMSEKVAPQSIPQLVLILGDYQYKNAFVADHELNVVACLTEVMSDVQFN